VKNGRCHPERSALLKYRGSAISWAGARSEGSPRLQRDSSLRPRETEQSFHGCLARPPLRMTGVTWSPLSTWFCLRSLWYFRIFLFFIFALAERKNEKQ
jgi:hypothetical protein